MHQEACFLSNKIPLGLRAAQPAGSQPSAPVLLACFILQAIPPSPDWVLSCLLLALPLTAGLMERGRPALPWPDPGSEQDRQTFLLGLAFCFLPSALCIYFENHFLCSARLPFERLPCLLSPLSYFFVYFYFSYPPLIRCPGNIAGTVCSL